MHARLHLNSRLLPVILCLVLLMQLIDPYRGWMILIIALGGAWLVSFLWTRSLARGLRLRREMRFGWAQVGDQLEERFTLWNVGWAPATWVELVDHSNLPDHNISWVTGIGTNASIQWHTTGLCTRRGLFQLGPTSLKSGDPFGIYSVEVHDPSFRTLMVMPPVVPLPTIEVAPGDRSGEGHPRPNAPERTVSAGSVREYIPGDSLRWIHWPTTARHDKPFVRIFDGTPAGDWRIILDLDQQVQVGEGWDATQEHGIILAASLADRGLRLKRAVGLVANGREMIWMPPAEGENQRFNILRALALAETGDRPLGELLRRMEREIRSHTSVILITPSTQSDWVEAVLPLMWRGVALTVLLIDPISFGGSGDIHPLMSLLAELGVSHYVITHDMLDRPEARPGTKGRWEWRVSPRGRAVLVRKPGDMSWKGLS
jgi:uncharacterized protein (DUF58 family)